MITGNIFVILEDYLRSPCWCCWIHNEVLSPTLRSCVQRHLTIWRSKGEAFRPKLHQLWSTVEVASYCGAVYPPFVLKQHKIDQINHLYGERAPK